LCNNSIFDYLHRKNTFEQEEYRSSGVQEFRRILKERTCLEIGATFLGVRVTIPHSQEFQWLP
jgi:hypothetical protein